jgi:hypothetical protein
MIAVDNLQVVCLTKGVWQLGEDPEIIAQTKEAQWALHGLKMSAGVVPWPGFLHMVLHLPRSENTVADAAAFIARVGGSFEWNSASLSRGPGDRILLMCDASFKQAVQSGGINAGLGCAIFLYRGDQSWVCVRVAGLALVSRSSVLAEFEALNFGLYRLVEFLRSCALSDSGVGLS